ncbi:cAMP-dependent protein kinase regulatory subunit [Smittium mucronatum]|uniref:cAMP-dependent protein kinase regulatory subunit n=1 Tax=Smittium mucronatum TaxID=133383 RepID=A0A1R0H828_9FUNG|nr:cAMP-dependent protein kinase regulatory subunit [Smittium mucronatum]
MSGELGMDSFSAENTLGSKTVERRGTLVEENSDSSKIQIGSAKKLEVLSDDDDEKSCHSPVLFTNPFSSTENEEIAKCSDTEQIGSSVDFNSLVGAKFSSLAMPSPVDETYLPPPGMGTRRFSVSAESMDPSTVGKTESKYIYKTPEQKERISNSLKGNFLFEQLDEDSYHGVVDAMEEKTVGPNVDVIVQGDVGDYFYIVETGEFDIYKSKLDSEGKPTGEPALVATVKGGGSFGEMALMYNSPRAATVRSTMDSTLWAIDRITFRRLLMERTFKKRQMYEKFLLDIPLLGKLEPYELQKISDSLQSCIFEDGETVIRQGDIGDSFYLIEEGHAIVLKKSPRSAFRPDDPILNTTPVKKDPSSRSVDEEDEDYFERQVGKLGKGDYFGELALLSNETRKATIVAEGKLKCVKMSKLSFERLLGPLIKTFRRKSTLYK